MCRGHFPPQEKNRSCTPVSPLHSKTPWVALLPRVLRRDRVSLHSFNTFSFLVEGSLSEDLMLSLLQSWQCQWRVPHTTKRSVSRASIGLFLRSSPRFITALRTIKRSHWPGRVLVVGLPIVIDTDNLKRAFLSTKKTRFAFTLAGWGLKRLKLKVG